MKKIEEYLENIKLHCADEVNEFLTHLRISTEMCSSRAFINILNQITEPFPYLQTEKAFTILERDIQIAIARRRLWLLLNFLSRLKTDKTTDILVNIDASIVSAFSDLKCLKFSLNEYDRNYLKGLTPMYKEGSLFSIATTTTTTTTNYRQQQRHRR